MDIDDSKFIRAKEIGAANTVNTKGMSPEQVGDVVKRLTEHDSGADLAIDALGGRITSLSAFFTLRKGGRLSQVGLTSQEEKWIVPVPMDLVVLREISICGSVGNPQSEYDDLLGLVASKKLSPASLVSQTVSLSDADSVISDITNFKTIRHHIRLSLSITDNMRKSFDCTSSGISPISSRKIVPLSACSNLPARPLRSAPVKEPAA